MESTLYPLADILAIAKIHPFYVSEIQYPPEKRAIQEARDRSSEETAEVDLRVQPFLRKKDLYKTIQRLIDDTSPQNTYRQSVYASTSGGAFGSKPLFFATDVHENRQQRAYFGHFLKDVGIIKSEDWALTVHCSGELYRSLDLILEILENAGVSVLSAGTYMSPAAVTSLLAGYHVNVLTGASSQVVQTVHHLSTLSPEERGRIKIDKIIYTSESLTSAQRAHIKAVLGKVSICSILGSAEAGPWAAGSPDLFGADDAANEADFIFDTRSMLIEILPSSCMEGDSNPEPLPDGEQGIIAQTSLARLRNPLVRYITGDIGSLHPLPEQARAVIPEAYWPYLRVLRLQGRDRRYRFEWDGQTIEFEDVTSMMNREDCGILEWQVILDKMEPSQESHLEIRMLYSEHGVNVLSKKAMVERVESYFHVCLANDYRFRTVFVDDLYGFERSSTGRKVIKFIDRVS